MLARLLAVRRISVARPAYITLARAGEELTPALAAILSPMATMAFAVAVWALCAQIAVAASFPIQSGALADWRVWLPNARGLQLGAARICTHGNSDDPRQ